MGCLCGWLVVIQKPSVEPLWLVAFVAKSAFVAACTRELCAHRALCSIEQVDCSNTWLGLRGLIEL